jgi:chromosome partitioning protein
MKVITLLNEKGGVGKTTLATHIAMGIARRGKTVVLVDSDAQGHATMMLGAERAPGIYELVVRRQQWKDAVVQIAPEFYGGEKGGSLLLLPSNVETRAIPNIVQDTTVLAMRLAELREYVDVVIIDTPPTPSMLHGSAYMATDYVLYPTQCHYLSIDGFQQAMGRLDAATKQRQAVGLAPIQVMGIVPTMYRSQTVDQQENLSDLQDAHGTKVWEPLANRTAWTEATTFVVPVWSVEGGNRAAAEINRVIDRVMATLYVETG